MIRRLGDDFRRNFCGLIVAVLSTVSVAVAWLGMVHPSHWPNSYNFVVIVFAKFGIMLGFS